MWKRIGSGGEVRGSKYWEGGENDINVISKHKKGKTKSKKTKKIWNLVCSGQWLLSIRPALEGGWYTHWRKTIFPLQAVINCKDLRGEGWNFMLTSHSPLLGSFSGSNPCRTLPVVRVAVNSHMHQPCTWKTVSLESSTTVAFTVFPCPLPYRALSFERRGVIKKKKMSHLGPRAPESLTCCTL